MPSIEDSTQPYQLLNVRNLESSKRDHFRPDPVPFDRPLTGAWSNLSNGGSYSGVATATLTVSSSTTAMSGDQFRCVGSNSFGTATTDPAVLIVNTGLTPLQLAQQAYVKASYAGTGDGFGTTVAVAGDTVVVGAPAESSNAIGV